MVLLWIQKLLSFVLHKDLWSIKEITQELGEKIRKRIHWVGKAQTPVFRYGVLTPAVHYDDFLILIISQFIWSWSVTTHGVIRIHEDDKLGQGYNRRLAGLCSLHAQRVERSYNLV